MRGIQEESKKKKEEERIDFFLTRGRWREEESVCKIYTALLV